MGKASGNGITVKHYGWCQSYQELSSSWWL